MLLPSLLMLPLLGPDIAQTSILSTLPAATTATAATGLVTLQTQPSVTNCRLVTFFILLVLLLWLLIQKLFCSAPALLSTLLLLLPSDIAASHTPQAVSQCCSV